MQALSDSQVAELLATANGNVSYQSNYARTTAFVQDGRWTRKTFARIVLDEIVAAERKAAYVAPVRPIVTGIRSQPYAGTFPRGKHSHKCKGCEERGQINAVACYKAKCTQPQLTATCSWCERYYNGEGSR